MAEHRDDPPLDDEDGGLHLGLVARLADAGRDDDGAVVPGEILVRPVDRRFVPVRLRHGGPEVVGDPDRAAAREVVEGPDVAADPGDDVLGEDGLDVGVARSAQHGDEQLGRADFAGDGVNHVDAVAAEVEEALLTGPVRLPHRRRQGLRPSQVPLAELAVAVSVGVGFPVLLPEQLLRHAAPLELPVYPGPIRLRPARRRRRLGREEQPLEGVVVVELRRQWPGQLGEREPAGVFGRGARRDPAALGDRAPGEALLQLESNNLT